MLTIITDNCGGQYIPDTLNLGCGTDLMSNAVNIDTNINNSDLIIVPEQAILVEGEITSPQDLQKKHFKRIEAHMVLEHIHPSLIPNLLYCLSNFLQDDGVLNATVPNFIYLAYRITTLYEKGAWKRKQIEEMQEINNEFMCPNMGNIGNHQSIWTIQTAKMWLNAEGFKLAEWLPSKHMMHLTFKATKLGGDHVSRIG